MGGQFQELQTLCLDQRCHDLRKENEQLRDQMVSTIGSTELEPSAFPPPVDFGDPRAYDQYELAAQRSHRSSKDAPAADGTESAKSGSIEPSFELPLAPLMDAGAVETTEGVDTSSLAAPVACDPFPSVEALAPAAAGTASCDVLPPRANLIETEVGTSLAAAVTAGSADDVLGHDANGLLYGRSSRSQNRVVAPDV